MPKGDLGRIAESNLHFSNLNFINFCSLSLVLAGKAPRKPGAQEQKGKTWTGKKVERQQKLTQMLHKLTYLDEQEGQCKREPEVRQTAGDTC